MIEYQNIFTQVQVSAPDYAGVPLENAEDDRSGILTHSYWAGKLGDAQIGPIYLGPVGVAAFFMGTLAFPEVFIQASAAETDPWQVAATQVERI